MITKKQLELKWLDGFLIGSLMTCLSIVFSILIFGYISYLNIIGIILGIILYYILCRIILIERLFRRK